MGATSDTTLDSGLISEDGNIKGGSCRTSNRSTSVINHLVNSTIIVCSVCTNPRPGGSHLPLKVFHAHDTSLCLGQSQQAVTYTFIIVHIEEKLA